MWWMTMVAWGQALENGGFEEGDLEGWTVTSQGFFDSVEVLGFWGVPPSEIPEGTLAARMQGTTEICVESVAISANLAFSHARPLLQATPYDVRIERVAGVVEFDELGDVEWSVTNIEAVCGERIELCLATSGGDHWIDDVGFTGPICAAFRDGDADGFCNDGIDRDGDGRCTAANELGAGFDCDDADASVFSGAVEIPDDGLDQDCDGEDETTGAPPTGTVDDGDTDTDADEGRDRQIQADGACACSASPRAMGLLMPFAIMLGLRRRTHDRRSRAYPHPE